MKGTLFMKPKVSPLHQTAEPPAKYEAITALVICAVVLTLMEYFTLPPRAQALLDMGGYGWHMPSLDAGLIWSASCFVGYFLIPVFAVKLVMKSTLKEHGFSGEGFWSHLKVYLFLYLLMLPLIYLASRQPEFRGTYPFIPEAKASMSNFLIWESCYVLQFFCLEFFFRGYLLFTLNRHMEKWVAIAVMVVPYCMIHFHKPLPEALGAIVAGVILGHLSLTYRSWLGGAVLHSLVAITLDVLASSQSGLFR
jgi:membrane protease YdiL (CAAX protease family)